MNSDCVSNNEKGNSSEGGNKTNYLLSIKSNYILKKIFNDLKFERHLKIIRHNKKLQKKLDKSINDYKDYNEIIFKIIPAKDKYGKFININENDKKYCHAYLDYSFEEKKVYNLLENDKVSKIIITIDFPFLSFNSLFKDCKCIEKINFIKFNRSDIENMSSLFQGCSSLQELDFSNFNTSGVCNMSCMFADCSSLKELDLSNFDTMAVEDMSCMFYGCSSLIELNISNFQTNFVEYME